MCVGMCVCGQFKECGITLTSVTVAGVASQIRVLQMCASTCNQTCPLSTLVVRPFVNGLGT